MSPNTNNEPSLSSYKFEDSNDYVIIYLYANGAIELKDVDIDSDSDSLKISTPAGQKWDFQLYAHIYPDRTEVTAEINESKTQTTIELLLYKQQVQTQWPQLCSRQSISIIPQGNEQNIEMTNEQISSSMQEQQPYQLSIKRLQTIFTETNDNRAIVQIQIAQVYDCQVQFAETNFTTTFYTNDELFLQTHSISSTTPIKLFIRVKERIKLQRCSHRVTPTYIEIILVKDSEHHTRWHQLEPNEHSESRPQIQLSATSNHPLSSTDAIVIENSSNKAIVPSSPLSTNRMSDNYSSGSSYYQKDITYSLSTALSFGFTGIYNPANSCFMNAALQCLANTCELRDYFLQAYHYMEINRTNPLGMKGIMAEEFANVIKTLWSGTYNYINANRLREYVAKRHQEFVGNGQHDAQELLTILLDALHEDLNRVITKAQVPPVEDENQPDYMIADEYWRGYLSRNDSLIVQLFTGQFKSKTKCPQCQKESVTFDPFTSLSVPIPKRITVDTIVTFRNADKPPIKYRILMSADGSIGELKRLLSIKCGLPIAKMVAYKILSSRTIEYLKNEDQVTSSSYSWSNFDITYITETLTSAECNDEKIILLTFFQRIFKIPDYNLSCAYCQALPNPHGSPTFCKHCYQVSYCDQQCLKFHKIDHEYRCGYRSVDNYEIIGLPFIVSLPESKLTCENVFEQISLHAKCSVDIQIERSKSVQRSLGASRDFDDYERVTDDDEEDSFSDIENVDWSTIKSTLSSSDSWSICRIGDYFVKTNKNKRHHNQQKDRKEKVLKTISTITNDDEEEEMIIGGDSGSNSTTDDFDMLDDIYGSQPLFRIMPQAKDSFTTANFEPIIEPGADADNILRLHTTFSIDWFTDNKLDAPLRVTPSKHRSGINDLVEDDSLFNSTSTEQDITLHQCLQLFIEPEVLGPDDKWYCPRCKEHIQAEKKMSVWRLPPILIIHLKRFKYNHCSYGYISNTREKIDTTIKFPTHDLNMAPYCSSASVENHDGDNSSQFRYDLYGIINHRGTAWFGHYTSYARLLANNDSAKTAIGWRNFDDDRVSSLTNVKDLVRADAYVLFYRHRNLSVNFNVQEQLQHILTETTNV